MTRHVKNGSRFRALALLALCGASLAVDPRVATNHLEQAAVASVEGRVLQGRGGGRGGGGRGKKDDSIDEPPVIPEDGGEEEEEEEQQTSSTHEEPAHPSEAELAMGALSQHETVSDQTVQEVPVVVQSDELPVLEPQEQGPSPMAAMAGGKGDEAPHFVVIEDIMLQDGQFGGDVPPGGAAEVYIPVEELPVASTSEDSELDEGVVEAAPGASVTGVVYQEPVIGKVRPADSVVDVNASPLATVSGIETIPAEYHIEEEEEPEPPVDETKPLKVKPVQPAMISGQDMTGFAFSSEANLQDSMEEMIQYHAGSESLRGVSSASVVSDSTTDSSDNNVVGKVSLGLWTMSLLVALAFVSVRKFRKSSRQYQHDESNRMLTELDLSDDLSVAGPDCAVDAIDEAINRITPLVENGDSAPPPRVEEAIRNMERARDLLKESQAVEAGDINPDVPRID